MAIDPQRVLAGLDDRQRAAVTSDAPVLCVVAGAGSGKTTVLTRRVAWRVLSGGADPERVLVVTFTRKAATELRQRLARLGVGPGFRATTFHAAAFSQLRRYWADRGWQPPTLLDDPRPLLRRLLEEDSDVVDGPAPVNDSTVSALWGELSWARARCVRSSDYANEARGAGRRPPVSTERMARLLGRYETEKRRRRVLDLDDLILRCTELLESDDAWAAAVRWQLRHLFVDEFQDVNPAQWQLLEAWRRDRPDLCVVGDPHQSIYSWNGSDPSLLDRLPTLVPGTEVLRLDENHRSSPQIVAVAGSLLAPGAGHGGTGTTRGRSELARPDGPLPKLHGFDDEDVEAAAVVRWLRVTRAPGHPWHHLAVLARTHARLEPVSRALQQAGIPWCRKDRLGDDAVAAVLGSLRSMDHALSLGAALVDVAAEAQGAAHPSPGADGALHGQRAEAAAEGRDVVVGLPPGLEQLVDEHALEEDRATVGSFLSWVAANGADRHGGEGRRDVVELATFHQAKGLEWDAVAVLGLEEGTMPIAYAMNSDALAEERRLLYVALTRAREHLWCSWATRRARGDGRPRHASSFLTALRTALQAEAPVPVAAAAGRVSELRLRLTAAR